MLLEKLGICLQKAKLDLSLTLYHINSKWIKDFNIRPENMKQLWEVVGYILEHISTGELKRLSI
jgi:hypothetical protein